MLEAQPDHPYALANRAEVLLLLRRGNAARADLDAARDRLDRLGGPADLLGRVEQLRTLAEATPP